MHILVVLTGGTIASAEQDGFLTLDSSNIESLVADARKSYSGEIDFSVINPFTIHSENLSADTLSELIRCLCVEVKKGYDGILVTHGTDTLQYSAAAAAFCLGSNSVPTVFVSSNYPLCDPKANGKLNFEAAVAFLYAQVGRGVYVAYSNDLETVDFHYAERVKNYPELSDKIFSVGVPPVCYQNGKFKINEKSVTPKKAEGLGEVIFCREPKILTLQATPFLEGTIDPSEYRAIVILPYHSGTLPTEQTNFVNFCMRCMDMGIPVFVPDVPSSTPYDSMRKYDSLGLNIMPEIPQISLFIKLWCAISLNQNICDFAKKGIGREPNIKK